MPRSNNAWPRSLQDGPHRMPSNASKSARNQFCRTKARKVKVAPSPIAEPKGATYEYEFEATEARAASCELDRLSPKMIGTLKLLAPLVWSTNYAALFKLEQEELEAEYGLMSGVMEMKEHVEKSSYQQRPWAQVKSAETYEEEESRRAMKIAAAAVRQGNQQRHTFSTLARSVRALSKRLPKVEWRAQSMNKELISRSTAVEFVKLVMAVRCESEPPACLVLAVRTWLCIHPCLSYTAISGETCVGLCGVLTCAPCTARTRR
jgi:hypothetical protein